MKFVLRRLFLKLKANGAQQNWVKKWWNFFPRQLHLVKQNYSYDVYFCFWCDIKLINLRSVACGIISVHRICNRTDSLLFIRVKTGARKKKKRYLHVVTAVKVWMEFLSCCGIICSMRKTLLNLFELLIIWCSYYKRKLKVLKKKLVRPTIIVLWTALVTSILLSSGLDCYVLTYGWIEACITVNKMETVC